MKFSLKSSKLNFLLKSNYTCKKTVCGSICTVINDDDESDLRDLEMESEYQSHVYDRIPSSRRLLCKASIGWKRHSIRSRSNRSDAISVRYSRAKRMYGVREHRKRKCTRRLRPCDTASYILRIV